MTRVGKTGGGASWAEVRRRLLEDEEADGAVAGVVMPSVSGAAKVSASSGSQAPHVEDKQDGDAIQHMLSDRFEQGLSRRGQARSRNESVQIDIEADREELAGRHLRLQDRPAAHLPTSSLLGTLAAHRKQGVRARQRVAKKSGSTAGGFGHLPHPGAWKAQPIPAAKQQVVAAPRSHHGFPLPRGSIAIS